MTPQPQSAHYPFYCPECGMKAPVYLRGNVPHLIPQRHCRHAVSATREGADIVVQFVRDEE